MYDKEVSKVKENYACVKASIICIYKESGLEYFTRSKQIVFNLIYKKKPCDLVHT